jgi:chemotaxis protein MotA
VFAILGIAIGISILFYSNHLEGDPAVALLKTDAALIVFGGTFTALMIHAGLRDLLSAVRCLTWVVRPPETDAPAFIEEVSGWARTARTKSVLALESDADTNRDHFTKVGLRALVDGRSYEDIRETLILVGDAEERQNSVAGEVWEAAGGYSPTIGVLGAVLGLIHVMLNMSHPDLLGVGIATAFVATIYGVGGANLIFLPLGARMRSIARHRMMYRELVMEGLLLLKKEASPMLIKDRLEALLESRLHARREMGERGADEPQPMEAD